MSGSGAKKRKQALARQVHSLSQQRLTYRQIAEVVGIYDYQVSTYIKLGERLKSLDDQPEPQNWTDNGR